MSTVGFLGLGRMGFAMAGRLHSAGFDLRVYNRTGSRADALVAAGAHRCATPGEVASGAAAVFSMVADDAASSAVWLGEDGALAAMTPGALVVECSTLSHDWVLELGARAQRSGLRYLDAPVTGLPEQAAAGDLTFLIGARRSDLDAARPLFDALGRDLIHFGSVGAGTAYKLLVNLLGAVQIASAAEAMAFGERAGLDPMQLAQALGSGQAASPQVIRNTRRMAEDQHDEPIHFMPRLRLKDVDYALALVRKLGIGAPFGMLAQTWFRDLCAAVADGVNESAVIEVARRQHP